MSRRAAKFLDLGCGGREPVVRYLIEHGYQLSGLDVAPSMIALVSTRFPRHRWIEGDMRKFDTDSSAYDGIIALSSLFHLDEVAQEKLIPRMAL